MHPIMGILDHQRLYKLETQDEEKQIVKRGAINLRSNSNDTVETNGALPWLTGVLTVHKMSRGACGSIHLIFGNIRRYSFNARF